jgi:hypothetical protein
MHTYSKISVIFCLLFPLVAFAQNQITLTSGQTDWVDPGKEYTYSISGAPSACSNLYQWESVEGINTTNNLGAITNAGSTLTIKWKNNTNSKNLNITNPTCPTQVSSLAKNISSIFLETPNNVFVNGVQSSIVPCGNDFVTIAINQPSTEPQFNTTAGGGVQLTYTWNIPEWSVFNLQTNSPSITINPQVSGNGTLSVSVKRNDAIVTTSISRTLTRSTPNITGISGDDLICSGQVKQYNLNFSSINASANPNITWSVSPTNLFQSSGSGSGSTATLQAANGISGRATLTFTIQTSCGSATFSRIMDIGQPAEVNMSSLNLWFSGNCAEGNTYQTYPLVAGANGGSSYTWDSVGDNGNFTLYTYGANNSGADVLVRYNSASFSVYSQNVCGVGPTRTFCITTGSGGPARIAVVPATVFPNPADKQFSIKFDKGWLPDELRLFDDSRRQIGVKTINLSNKISNQKRFVSRLNLGENLELTQPNIVIDNELSWDVSELPNGVYYLHLIKKDEREQAIRIIVQH